MAAQAMAIDLAVPPLRGRPDAFMYGGAPQASLGPDVAQNGTM
jgi:hypothetical protein